MQGEHQTRAQMLEIVRRAITASGPNRWDIMAELNPYALEAELDAACLECERLGHAADCSNYIPGLGEMFYG